MSASSQRGAQAGSVGADERILLSPRRRVPVGLVPRAALQTESSMRWIVARMKWVLLVSGALTCSMLYAAIAPQAALLSTFGDSLEGPVAEIVVRNWGVLIALMGAMLIYAAFNTTVRPLTLVVAGTSKVVFIALILSMGRPFLSHQAGVAVVSDIVQVALFLAYLLSPSGRSASPTR
jgi:energy-converting hydrogenase Eha subunit E